MVTGTSSAAGSARAGEPASLQACSCSGHSRSVAWALHLTAAHVPGLRDLLDLSFMELASLDDTGPARSRRAGASTRPFSSRPALLARGLSVRPGSGPGARVSGFGPSRLAVGTSAHQSGLGPRFARPTRPGPPGPRSWPWHSGTPGASPGPARAHRGPVA